MFGVSCDKNNDIIVRKNTLVDTSVVRDNITKITQDWVGGVS